MHCFHHPDRNAVAVCRCCFRALCRVCCVEFSNGVACSEECQEATERANQQIDDLRVFMLKAYRRRRPKLWLNAVSLCISLTLLGYFAGLALHAAIIVGRSMR
jgi:hypothetical protein